MSMQKAIYIGIVEMVSFVSKVCNIGQYTEKMLNVQTVQGTFDQKILKRSLTIRRRSLWLTSVLFLVLDLSITKVLTS